MKYKKYYIRQLVKTDKLQAEVIRLKGVIESLVSCGVKR